MNKSHLFLMRDQCSEENNFKITEGLNLLPEFINLNQKQKDVLKDIWNKLKLMHDLLNNLFLNANIEFELCVAGGAIRDILLNKVEQIGDYDIILKLQTDYDNYPVKIENLENEFCKVNSSSEIIKEIKSAIEKKFNEPAVLIGQKELNNDKYIMRHLFSLIKGSVDNKKIDVLINSVGSNEIFISLFDFELCKASLKYSNINNGNDSDEQIFNNIRVSPGFAIDVCDKTLSIMVKHFKEDHIEYFLKNHYKKMTEKFPEYKLKFIGMENNERHKSLINLANKINLKVILEENIGEEKITEIKMKI